MKSLAIATLVSALYALWLSNCVVEGGTLKVKECEVEKKMDGILNFLELNVENDKVMGSKLDIQQTIDNGIIAVVITIYDENKEVIQEQTYDFCGLCKHEIYGKYPASFKDSKMNKGNCPIEPGTYISGELDMAIDDAPEGTYTATIIVKEGSNQLSTTTCVATYES